MLQGRSYGTNGVDIPNICYTRHPDLHDVLIRIEGNIAVDFDRSNLPLKNLSSPQFSGSTL